MKGIFNAENPFFHFIGIIFDILILSLMWLLCCLPVVTLGPATSALYYSCAKCLRYGEPGPYKSYWLSFRTNLATGSVLTLIFFPFVLLLGFGGAYLYLTAVQVGGSWTVLFAAYMVLTLLPLSIMLCAFCLISRFTYKLGDLLKDSFRATVQNLPRLALTAIMAGVIFWLTSLLWNYGLPIFAPGIIAYLATYLLEPMLHRYTPDYDPEDEREPEERPWYLR